MLNKATIKQTLVAIALMLAPSGATGDPPHARAEPYEDWRVDCTIAPILWRLPAFGIKLPPQARPIQRYMDEVFSRPSFQASLTEFEQEIRQ